MAINDELEKRLQDLEGKIEQLTTLCNKIINSRQQVVHYHIDKLDIQNAQIEKLDYHLDSIGIEQLSGTLNIGNNFEAKKSLSSLENPDLTKKKEDKEKKSQTYHPIIKKNESEEPRNMKVTTRKNGFSVKMNAKEES